MAVALWSREELAADSTVADPGGWGGVTIAYNVRSPAEVDAVVAEAEAAGATIGRTGAETFWGGYSARLRRPRRPPVGGRPQPALDDRRRRLRHDLDNSGGMLRFASASAGPQSSCGGARSRHPFGLPEALRRLPAADIPGRVRLYSKTTRTSPSETD